MQCPACGADWPDEIRYCGECGGRMPDATVVASPYKVQVEATNARAPSGSEVTTDRYAPAPLSPPTPPTPLSPPPTRRASEPHRVSDEGDLEVSAPVPAQPVEAGPEVDPLEIDVRGGNVAHAGQLLLAPDPPTLATVQHVDLSVLGEAWRFVSLRMGNLAVGTLVIGLATSALLATGIGAFALGPLYGGLAIVGVRVASGRAVSVNDFFDGLLRMQALLLLGLMTAAVVTLGTIALVLPGLYLAMASCYAPFLVVDRGDAPWPALVSSIETVNARLPAHLGLFAVLALLNAAGSLPCGLGLLVSVPLSVVAIAVCYGRLFGFTGGVDRLR